MPKYLNGVPYYTKTEAINAMSRAGAEAFHYFRDCMDRKEYPVPVLHDAAGDVYFRREVLDEYIQKLIERKQESLGEEVPVEVIRQNLERELDPKDSLLNRLAPSTKPPEFTPKMELPMDVKEVPENEGKSEPQKGGSSGTPMRSYDQMDLARKLKFEKDISFENLAKSKPVYKQEIDVEKKEFNTLYDKFLQMSWGKESFGIGDFVAGLVMQSQMVQDLVRGYPQQDKDVTKKFEFDDERRSQLPLAGEQVNKELNKKNQPEIPFAELVEDNKEKSTDDAAETLKEIASKLERTTTKQEVPPVPLTYMASGGEVDSHPGKPKGTDTVPAWLTPNEYVINPVSAQYNKALLDKINNTQGPVYFASGGQAQSPGKQATSWAKDTFDTAQLGVRAAAGDPTAIKGLIEKAIDKLTDKIEKVINVPFDFLSGKNEKAGDLLSSLGDITPVVGPLISVLGKSIETLRSWNEQMMKSNFQFAEFSASMAQIKAIKEMWDIQLSFTRGERRSAMAAEHTRSAFELEKRLSVYEDAAANLRNAILTNLNDKVSSAVDMFEQLFPAVADYIKQLAHDSANDSALSGNPHTVRLWNTEAGNSANYSGGLPRRFMGNGNFEA